MILYRNAKIFTADKDNPWADCMAVEDGKILWACDYSDVPEFEDEYEDVDLGGRTVIPGLIDSHQHCLLMANFIKGIAALPPKIHNMSELAEAVREAEKTLECGRWIEGWGYDEGKLEEKRKPNRYDLDKGSLDIPVVMVRACQHIVSVNSKALEIARITKDTPDPPGGVIGRDENGEPDEEQMTKGFEELFTEIAEGIAEPKESSETKNAEDAVANGLEMALDVAEILLDEAGILPDDAGLEVPAEPNYLPTEGLETVQFMEMKSTGADTDSGAEAVVDSGAEEVPADSAAEEVPADSAA